MLLSVLWFLASGKRSGFPHKKNMMQWLSIITLTFLASAMASPVHMWTAPTCYEELKTECRAEEHMG